MKANKVINIAGVLILVAHVVITTPANQTGSYVPDYAQQNNHQYSQLKIPDAKKPALSKVSNRTIDAKVNIYASSSDEFHKGFFRRVSVIN